MNKPAGFAIMLFAVLLLIVSSVAVKVTAQGNGSSSEKSTTAANGSTAAEKPSSSTAEKSTPFQGELLPGLESSIKPNLSPPISIKPNLSPPISIKPNLSPPKQVSIKPNTIRHLQGVKTLPESAVSCHVIGGKMFCPRVFACHNPGLQAAQEQYQILQEHHIRKAILQVCPSGKTLASPPKKTKPPLSPM